MRVLALLFMAGFLSFTNFMCSGKPKYQDFSSDTTSHNYVRQCLADTLFLSKSNTFCDKMELVAQLKDSRNNDDIFFNAVKLVSLSD